MSNQCSKLNGFGAFKDGRMFCPDTMPQNVNEADMKVYNITCTCDKCPGGCPDSLSVFTDGVEAVRDHFWGRSCPDNISSITVNAKKA